MTYKQEVEELIEKYKTALKHLKLYIKAKMWSSATPHLKACSICYLELKALKAKIEAEGCGTKQIYWDRNGLNGAEYYCVGKEDWVLCPDCQEAIKILDEVLE